MKKYLFLAATAALMFGSCSDDITKGGNDSSTNGLKLTTLSQGSQANRITAPSATRGEKSERLTLVATIAPVKDAAKEKWSATSIDFAGGNAYITWHSNRQASDPATAWGGALDIVNASAVANRQFDEALTKTMSGRSFKFNNVVADGSNLYFALTDGKKGASVGRLVPGAEVIDTVVVPGSSANSVYLKGSDVYVATGYRGGVYKFAANNFDAEERAWETVMDYSSNFGGKYIADGYLLRTDNSNGYIVNLETKQSYTIAALKSAEKVAESYDAETGNWTSVDGETAAYYGKHTMAVKDNKFYVGGGLGSGGANGLRVYNADGTISWQNGNSTVGVCVDNKYVYAASEIGLRVYDRETMELFAFEVSEYDGEGRAVEHAAAGTTGHSGNFVAIDPESGLIYVAYGQKGVYVFQLNQTASPVEVEVSLTIPAINDKQSEMIQPDETKDFTIPTTKPADKEDEYFAGWTDVEGGTEVVYEGGDTVTVSADTPAVTLYPVYKSYALIVKFEGNLSNETFSNMPGTIKVKEGKTTTITNVTPKVVGKDAQRFLGWSTDKNTDPRRVQNGTVQAIQPGQQFTYTGDGNVVTLYGVWITDASSTGNQGGGEEQKPQEENPDQSGSMGDPNNGTMN